ncbi:hypothetical protein F4805DRAFT_424919 [Annulohypoxylon moriforme]|nr:hypothetical protein F4805DRAFT_424919 [Annulohypoxylon moriforme]
MNLVVVVVIGLLPNAAVMMMELSSSFASRFPMFEPTLVVGGRVGLVGWGRRRRGVTGLVRGRSLLGRRRRGRNTSSSRRVRLVGRGRWGRSIPSLRGRRSLLGGRWRGSVTALVRRGRLLRRRRWGRSVPGLRRVRLVGGRWWRRGVTSLRWGRSLLGGRRWWRGTSARRRRRLLGSRRRGRRNSAGLGRWGRERALVRWGRSVIPLHCRRRRGERALGRLRRVVSRHGNSHGDQKSRSKSSELHIECLSLDLIRIKM